MKYIVISFDLKNAKSTDYPIAEEILEKKKLYAFSPNKALDLPSTTVIGKVDDSTDINDFIKIIISDFKQKRLEVDKILGGFIHKWIAITKKS